MRKRPWCGSALGWPGSRWTPGGPPTGAWCRRPSYEGQAERWAQGQKTPTWPGRLFLAESGEVVGFAAFGPDRASGFPGRTAELWALYVLPTWQGKGLGRALFQGGSVGLGPPGAGLLRAPGRGAFAGGTELWEVACGFDLGG